MKLGVIVTILYHFASVWQAMFCMVHKMKYRDGNFCVAMVEEQTASYIVIENLKRCFNDAYVYPTRAKLTLAPKEKIIQTGKKFYNEICGYRLEEFDEIFVSYAFGSFGMYLTFNGIHFNYVEDSNFHIFTGANRRHMEMIRRASDWGRLLDNLGISDLTSQCIDKIYAAVPKGAEFTDARIVPFQLKNELLNLSEEQKEMMVETFGNNDIKWRRKTAIIATSNYVRTVYYTEQENNYFHTVIADYFVPMDWSVCIKPHPGDVYDYKKLFPGCTVLSHKFPVELVLLFNDEKDILFITPNSMAVHFFKNNHMLWIHPELGIMRKWLYSIHRQWATAQIYDYLSALHEQMIYVKFVDKSFKYCWHIEDTNDVLDADLQGKSIVIPVDDDLYDVSFLERILQRNDYVFVFYNIFDNLFQCMSFCEVPILPKKIIITSDETGERREEYLYILTNNKYYRDTILNLKCEKYLKYSKEDVKMDVMTEEEMEMAALRGQLEATEKRLKQVVEENKELRARIEVGTP